RREQLQSDAREPVREARHRERGPAHEARLVPRSRSSRSQGAPHGASRGRARRERKLVMGQKTHPIGFRLGFTKTWNAKWFANKKNYPVLLKEDIGIRNAIRGRLRDAAIARIDIERSANQVTVTIQTAKPGVVIGKGGAKVEELRQVLGKMTAKNVKVNIFEIRYPELDANLRSEEHTSELQSLAYLVCRLLLENVRAPPAPHSFPTRRSSDLIDIERSANQVTVTIQTAKPGVVIGKGGAKVEELRQVLGKMTAKNVKVNIFEIRYPELDANL